ncbi:ankyrin repeat-containing domain protein [Dactylonectria macrodidyma]|uniref:Ankyrin repeat-containing domain protein n=1 Tax=Dactylonectria macrodidyma TaxID=307937 RepID=A0A9P9JR70_9HYPO|nr:ankyrin repeat-containing domain protein [Dactylonectria macrodidyma]
METKGNRSRPSEFEWSRHEGKIRKLFVDENNSLAVVMEKMKREDGFSASKSQYETRFKKWKIKKYHKREDWKIISLHLKRRMDLGKRSDVSFEGRPVSILTVQREISRLRLPSTQSPARVGMETVLRTLPPGFRIRTPPPLQMEHLELPTEQMYRVMDELNGEHPRQEENGTLNWSLFITSNRVLSLPAYIDPRLLLDITDDVSVPEGTALDRPIFQEPSTPQTSPGAPRTVFDFGIHPAVVQGLLPASTFSGFSDGRPFPSSSSTIHRPQPLHSAYAKLLMFAIANNFAGMENLSHENLWEFLRADSRTLLVPFLSLFPKHTAKRLAAQLLQCAIEGDDARGVELFFGPDINLNPNEVVCRSIFGSWRTPIEVAAIYRSRGVIEVLLRHGADVNKKILEPHEQDARGGALALVLGRHRFQPPEADLDPTLAGIVEVLICAGASVSPLVLDYNSVKSSRIMLLLVQAGMSKDHADCFRRGVLHSGLKYLDSQTAVQILRAFLSTDVSGETISEHNEPKGSESLVDLAAKHSHLALIELLLATKRFSLSTDTLAFAIMGQSPEVVRFVLARGARVDLLTSWDTTPFAEAIYTRNPELLRILGEYGVRSPMDKSKHFSAALRAFCTAQDLDAVESLLDMSVPCDPKALCYGLITAIEAEYESLAIRLIEAGADINDEEQGYGERRGSPLWTALAKRNETLVRMLLQCPGILVHDIGLLRLAVDWGNPSIVMELLLAGFTAGNRELVDLLLQYGASINPEKTIFSHEEDVGDSPLSAAVRRSDQSMVLFLFSVGADPADNQALGIAINSGNHDLTALLLKCFHQRYPRGNGIFGLLAMKSAVRSGDAALVQKLLANNLSFKTLFWFSRKQDNPVRAPGRIEMPLVDAIESEHECSLAIMRLLFDAGTDLNAVVRKTTIQLSGKADLPATQAETPILVAIGSRQLTKVRWLVERGVDVTAPPHGVQRTPLQKAAEMGVYSIVEYLLRLGADVNAPPAGVGGATALQFAVIHGFVGVAQLLLRHGAEVDAPPARRGGRMALEGAAEHGRLDSVKLLLDAGAGTDGMHREQFDRAIQRAEGNGHLVVADLLRGHDARQSPGVDGSRGIELGERVFEEEFVSWDPEDGGLAEVDE